MDTLRRPHIAHVLIVCACSGTDPSAGGSMIEGVHALEPLSCNGTCPQENIAGAALARGHVWFSRDYWYCPTNGGNCGASTTLHVGFAEAAFGADGGLSLIEQTPDTQGTGTSSGVGVAPDESVAYFAYTNDVKSLIVVQGFSNGVDAGVAQFAGQGYVTGVVADGRSAVVGVSTNGSTGSPMEQVDQGAGPNLVTGGPGNKPVGALVRLNLDDGGVAQQNASFDVTVTHHLTASSGGTIYGIGIGTVWSAPVDLSAAPTTIGQIPAAQTGPACTTSSCVSSGVGIDVANGVVAWSVLQGDSVCKNGPCTLESPICSVWKVGASPTQSTRIYQGAGACLGLAIDATYAYFALVESQLDTSCNGCNSYDLFTTGIARVALNGPDTQQPTVLKLDATRLYGPRRFFTDDTYVYGIDPAYVLRIPKTAFGP